MLMCTGLLEPKSSALGLLKFAFNAEDFIRRYSWSIFRHFVAIHCWNCAAAKNCEKFTKGRSRSSMMI